ncbi:MAG: hypothetical protein Kilf2KO_47680 [Rhodospirillales bacterium]
MTLCGKYVPIVALALLLGCTSAPVETAQAPATPVSLLIQRLDDPNQAAIAYSSRKIYQRGSTRPEGKGIPPDRIGWTLLGLQDRITGQRRYRLTLAMTYDNEETAGYRNYDRAQVLPNGPALAVQPFSRNRGNCGGALNNFCLTNEVVFAWLAEETLRNAEPEGLVLQVNGEIGRGWEFTVPKALIQALFDKMDRGAAG